MPTDSTTIPDAIADYRIVRLLAQGKSIALVTDAGTPGLSDPGAELVGQVRRHRDELRELTDHVRLERVDDSPFVVGLQRLERDAALFGEAV